jgi:hypothetical protein
MFRKNKGSGGIQKNAAGAGPVFEIYACRSATTGKWSACRCTRYCARLS